MPLQLDLGHAILRELVLNDAPSLALHANDWLVWVQLRDMFPHPYREEDATEFIQRIQIQNQPTAFALAVNDQVVGVIGLIVQPDINRLSAEIGYWVGTAHWGKGIATAAVRALTTWSMAQLGFVRIFATPFIHHVASCRVLEKAGYLREGLMRKSAIKDGQVLDQVLYAYVG
ncbi:MAG: GNAT family protein [Nitrospira sp.]|nr:MAG: GNAT family N-acetyltransferase [Nitrospira sp.]